MILTLSLWAAALGFGYRLYQKWIGGNLTDDEQRPGMEGVRAWLAGGNVVVALATGLLLFLLSPGISLLSALMLPFLALIAYPLLNTLFRVSEIRWASDAPVELSEERNRVFVRRVLFEQQSNYRRGWQYRFLQRMFGDNLVVSEGALWKRRRRLAQPSFHHKRLTRYAEIMADATNETLERWQNIAKAGEAIETLPEMALLAMRIAALTFFSRDAASESDSIRLQFAEVVGYLERRFHSPFTTPPLWVPTAANQRFKQAVQGLNGIVSEYVRQRRSEDGDRGDLLSMLIEARHPETGEQLTDEELLVVAMILQRFDVELVPGPPIQPKASLVLKPDQPVWIRLKRR